MVQGTDTRHSKLNIISCTATSNGGDENDNNREAIDKLRGDQGETYGSNHAELARLRDEVQTLHRRVAFLEAATDPEAQLSQLSSDGRQEGDPTQTQPDPGMYFGRIPAAP